MSNKMQINMVKGKNCFYANLASILSYYGYQYSEAELFFLSDSTDCFFSETKTKRVSDVITMYSCDEAADKIAGILSLEKKAFEYNYSSEFDHKQFLDNMLECMNNSYPIICMMNQKVLNYQPQYYIELQEARHGIIIYGFDDKKKNFYIGDSFVMDSQGVIDSYVGVLPFDVLMNNLYGYIWLEPLAEKKNAGINKEVLLSIVLNNLQRMLYSKKVEGKFIGNSAIKKGFEYVADSIKNERVDNEDVIEFIHFLKMRYVIVFEYIADIINNVSSNTYLWNQIIDIKNEWDNIITRLLIITYSKASVNKISSIVNSLVEKQEEVIRDTICVLENINN